MTTENKKNISTRKIVSPTHIFSAPGIFIEIAASCTNSLPQHLDWFLFVCFFLVLGGVGVVKL